MVLEFHHPGGKAKEIRFMLTGGYPIATIRAEIAKCHGPEIKTPLLCGLWATPSGVSRM